MECIRNWYDLGLDAVMELGFYAYSSQWADREYWKDVATFWFPDSVRFLLEIFTETTLWNFFTIDLETLILRVFQNLSIPDQVIGLTRQR